MNKKKVKLNLLIGIVTLVSLVILLKAICFYSTWNLDNFQMAYKVKHGETATDVAKRFGIKPDVLKNKNHCNEYLPEDIILVIPQE